jgi:hypothetical protein
VASARERVDLAIAELKRTGAFDRPLLVLVSPTGHGYVNYVAVAALQYLTLGDVATVTLQYSRRPSPLSLRMVRTAREQNRLLWLRVLQRSASAPVQVRASCCSARASERTPARTSSSTGACSASTRWASAARRPMRSGALLPHGEHRAPLALPTTDRTAAPTEPLVRKG